MAVPLDSMAAVTLHVIRKRLADNIFLANPTAAYFLMTDRVEVQEGGQYIQEPLTYAKNSTVTPYSGYGPFSTAPTDTETGAIYNWRQLAVAISANGLEVDVQNVGAPAILKLLQNKINNAENSLNEWLDEKIHAPVTSKTPLDILGVDDFVEDEATPNDVVGGIDRATNSWWQNKSLLSSGFVTLNQDMRKLYNRCSDGRTYPKIGITTDIVYQEYENQNAGKLRVTNNDLLDIGFDNLKFKGMTLVWNRHCIGPDSAPSSATSNLYMLNPDHMRFVIAKNRNFFMTPWKQPVNQDAKVAHILFAGNMTLSNSRFQGVLYGIG